MTDARAIALLSALAQPVRLAIVRRLRAEPDGMRAGDLAAAVGITKTLMSAHLAVLERAGAVRVTRSGREANVRLQQAAITTAGDWIRSLGACPD